MKNKGLRILIALLSLTVVVIGLIYAASSMTDFVSGFTGVFIALIGGIIFVWINNPYYKPIVVKSE